MSWRFGLFAVLVLPLLVIACTKHNPAACCTTEADCIAKDLPAGTGCEDGYQCVMNTCTPQTSCQASSDCAAPTPLCSTDDGVCVECLSDAECETGVCDAGTHACRPCVENNECASGFCLVSAGECRPGLLTPKYLPTVCDTSATASWTLDADSSIDTTDDAQCMGGIVPQPGGPDICVVHYQSVTIPAVERSLS